MRCSPAIASTAWRPRSHTCSQCAVSCILLLQEVETDIRTRVQLTSAQSDAAAWYMVLGTYAVLTSHINNLTSHPARQGLFPEAANTSTPQPLPPLTPPSLHPLPTPLFLPPFPPPPPPHHSPLLFHPLHCLPLAYPLHH